MFLQEKLNPMYVYLQHYDFLERFLCKINNSSEVLLFAQIPEITSVFHLGLLQFVLMMKYEWKKRAMTVFAVECLILNALVLSVHQSCLRTFLQRGLVVEVRPDKQMMPSGSFNVIFLFFLLFFLLEFVSDIVIAIIFFSVPKRCQTF